MADTPNTATEQLSSAVSQVIAEQGQAVGTVQDALANVVDGNIAIGNQAVQKITRSLGVRATRAVNGNQKLVNTIVGQLGENVASAIGANAQAMSQIAGAAVGMPVSPTAVAPSASAPVDQQWGGWYRCDPQPAIITQLWSQEVDQLQQSQGWSPFPGNPFASNQLLNDWINANQASFLAAQCPGAGVGGGAGNGTGTVLRVWALKGPCGWQFDGAPDGSPAPAPGWVDTGIVYHTTGNPVADGQAIYRLETQFAAANPFIPDPSCAQQTGSGGSAGGGGTTTTGGTGGATCPPPIPCPPPPQCPKIPPPPPPDDCGQFPVPEFTCQLLVDGKLPQPGSVEWCACIKDIADWLDAIGQWFACQIDDITGPQTGDVGGVEMAANAAVAQVVASLLPTQVIELASRIQQRQGSFWGGLKSAITQFAAITSTRLLGLALARAALHVFKQLRVGWDLAVWGTVDVEIIIDPLDKMLVYVEQYIFQWDIPSVGEAIECYLYRTTTDEQVACWMACHGANWDTYHPVILSRRERLTDSELIQVNRRSNLDDDAIALNLRSQGWIDPAEAAQRIELSYELPTISDHLHWLQRNVFDQQYVTDYQLLDGFTEKFWPRFGHDLHALGMRQEYAELHYAAHWITPAVGQLAEMMQRLRPGRVDPSIEFTEDDFSRLLVEQDIAPWYRERLKAVAFRTMPLRQLNAATQQGRFDRDELVARWQDIGFTAADAGTLADTSLVQAARQIASNTHAYTAALVSELAQFGAITLAEAIDKLTPQGYTEQQVVTLIEAAQARRRLAERKKHDEASVNTFAQLALQAYADGTVDKGNANQALTQAGYSNDAATLALSTVDLRVRKQTVDLAISTVHKGFRLGATDGAGALNALVVAGVTQQMAQVYVSRWQLERSIPHVAAATAAILRWTRKGIMSVAQAAARLKNLGWTDGDINLQLLEVEQEAQQAQAAATAKTAKALAQAQAQAKAAIRSTQRNLCRIYTPSKMVRWYALRIIDESIFRSRLETCGYTAEATEGLFREASVARDAKDAKAEKKGASGVEYTGQGAVPGGPAP